VRPGAPPPSKRVGGAHTATQKPDFTGLTTARMATADAPLELILALRGILAPGDTTVHDLAGVGVVFTARCLPPMVDDAQTYGAIAANAAMGEVYAAGGQPLLALHLASLPTDMPPEIAQAILRGGAEQARRAGAVVVGGHSGPSAQPTYGLAVLGRVAPEQVVHRGGARPGDRLVLTKAIGTGVITSAGRQGTASAEALAAAVTSMLASDAPATEAARGASVHGGNVVGGSGLVGSALEMAHASRTRVVLHAEVVPLLRDALHHAGEGTFPQGTRSNEEQFARHSEVGGALDPLLRRVLFAPETAGGLLLAVPPHAVAALLANCAARGVAAAAIGEVRAGIGVLIE